MMTPKSGKDNTELNQVRHRALQGHKRSLEEQRLAEHPWQLFSGLVA